MLKLGNQIKLTPSEKRNLAKLTGASPEKINTVEAFNQYIDFHAAMYSANSPEEVLLKHLLESSKINT